ncbi:hypothetical protein TWF730_008071 [Orbilia blumenaviensis]|uniref:F-box domain-containing protein n=1 Tax=Orbilia blumenaviensis TaxID=1796055 RepID=A0AAV9VA82_9PEZI
MQRFQRILTNLLQLFRSPFTILLHHSLLPFRHLRSNAKMSPPTTTTIFSLPPELHLQILAYLPFSSHISLISTHPFFYSLLQDNALKAKRYYPATYPAVHILLKDYTLKITVRNGDIDYARIEVVDKIPKIDRFGKTTESLGPLIVASIPLSPKHGHKYDFYKRGEGGCDNSGLTGSILDDYWLWISHRTDLPETMDLKKLVVLLKVPEVVAKNDKAKARQSKDKRRYWSTEYPFRIARPDLMSSLTSTSNRTRPSSFFQTSGPPTEPATLREIIKFIIKKVIKDTGLKNEKEVKVTLRVCKLGGVEGYVGFTGTVTVVGGDNGGWGGWLTLKGSVLNLLGYR